MKIRTIKFVDIEEMMRQANEARSKAKIIDMRHFKSLVWEQCKDEIKLPTRSEYMRGAIEYARRKNGEPLDPATLSDVIRKCSVWHDALIIRFNKYLETITEETEEE